MAYDGYLIKIEGNVFPMKHIVRDSWECTPGERKILEEANDAYGIRHVKESPHKRTTISFKIGEHNSSDHEEIVSFLQKVNEVDVIYLNDMTGSYERGNFRIENFKFKHKNSFNKTLWYDETTVKMVEY